MRLSPSFVPLLAVLFAFGGATFSEGSAAAETSQLSEAERKSAARSLFQQGVKEQDAGHYAEALSLFQKAQKLFDAPTHLLHIAQCQVLTGKLVEAAETYETLKRVSLAAGAPDVFVQAKTQAEAELPGVRARIPNLKIDLSPKPEQLRNLQLVINDVVIPVELVGVARPVNPGVTKIVARADGYQTTSLEVTVKEKETRSVGLSLSPGASAPLAAPPPVAQPYPPQYPPQQQQYPQYPPGQQPYPYELPPRDPPKPTSSTGIIAGVHLGVLGSLKTGTTSNSGFAGGVDFLFRFAHVALVGATVQVAGNDAGNSYFGAARFGFLTHPEKFAFTAGVLGGVRGSERGDGAGTFGGTLGFSIPIGAHVRLDPRLDLTASSINGELSPFLFFGMGGAFNHNFAPKAEVPTK